MTTKGSRTSKPRRQPDRDGQGQVRGTPPRIAGRQLNPASRDWGLLVADQIILDLVYRTPLDRLTALAARFLAIHDAIKEGDLDVISAISRESSAPLFRDTVAAIE